MTYDKDSMDSGEERALARLLAQMREEDPGEPFSRAVMQRLQSNPNRLVRMWQALLAPRQSTFQWSFARVFAGALLLAVLGWGASTWLLPPAETAPVHSVTLALVAPDASSVTVAGDFNGWAPARHALHDQDGNGVWTITLDLPSGRYEYMFVVDGETWIADPMAQGYSPDSFGGRNAVLEL